MHSFNFYLHTHHLWPQTLRVTREQRCQSHVRQSQEEHHDTVQSQATTGVRRAALAESIQVILKALLGRVQTLAAHRCLQLLDVMDTLGSRHDLLATHEEVIRVGEAGVLRVGLGVEWPHGHGELVQHVEVGVVLVADDLAQLLLHRRGEIVLEALLLGGVDTGLLQKRNTVHVVQAQRLAVLGQLEVTSLGIRLLDGRDLSGIPLLQLAENEDQQVLGKLQHLVVVVLEGLLEIKTGEL